MKNTLLGIGMGLAALMTSFAPATALAQSDSFKPAIVVSVAPAEEQLADINYLAALADQKQMAGILNLFAGEFLRPFDQTRPSGAYALIDGPVPTVVGFLPLVDIEAFKEVTAETLGEPEEDGDYLVFTTPEGDEVFLLQSGDWGYISNEKSALSDVPEDPTTLIAGLEEYNIALRVNGQNIPDEMKQMATFAMQQGFDEMLDELEQVDPEAAALQREMNGASLEQLGEMIQQLDTVVVGLNADADAKAVMLDFSITGIEGSLIAEQTAQLSGTASDFLGFLIGGSAFNFNSVSLIAEADIDRAMQMLDTATEKMLEELEDDPSLNPMEREASLELANSLIDVAKATIEGGKLDFGGAVILDDSTVALVSGVRVLETGKLEDSVRTLVALAQEGAPEGVEFNLDIKQEDGINYHQIVIPVPEFEDEAQEIFGPELTLWLGVADEAVYLAVGKNCESALATAINDSASAQPTEGRYAQFNLDVGKIVEFAASVQDDPQIGMMAEAMGGEASMSIYGDTIENGARSRILIREDFISAVGQVVGQFMQAMGPGAQF